MKITIKNTDAFRIFGDVLVLKYAQALYGLDSVVVEKLEVKNNIQDKLPLPNEELITNSNPIENYKKILFIGVCSLHEFQYNEIEEFTKRALSTIQKKFLSSKIVVFTLHGQGYGLDVEKAFKSELEGIRKFLHKNIGNSELEEIIFVEKNKDIVEQISPILEEFIKDNQVILTSDLMGVNSKSFKMICKSVNEKKVKLPSNKKFGVNIILETLSKRGIENTIQLEVKNILDRLIQFEQRIKDVEDIDPVSFLYEELNPVYLDIQLYLQKINDSNYHEVGWAIQIYLLNYLIQVCRSKKISDSYFLKRKEELINHIRFALLNYFGKILIPVNKFPWVIVEEIMNSTDFTPFWRKLEKQIKHTNDNNHNYIR